MPAGHPSAFLNAGRGGVLPWQRLRRRGHPERARRRWRRARRDRAGLGDPTQKLPDPTEQPCDAMSRITVLLFYPVVAWHTVYCILRCGAPLWGSFLCAISSTIEKYKIASKAPSLMCNHADTSDPDRQVAETRQGRARWQNDDGQAARHARTKQTNTCDFSPTRPQETSIA